MAVNERALTAREARLQIRAWDLTWAGVSTPVMSLAGAWGFATQWGHGMGYFGLVAWMALILANVVLVTRRRRQAGREG